MASRTRLSFAFLAFFLTLFSSNIVFSSVVTPTGGGSGGGASTTQGIGGGATSTPGADSVVNVKNYGAKGDGKIVADAAMTGGFTAKATSTAPSAPAVTTSLNNEVVVSIFGLFATFTPPVTPTQFVNIGVVSNVNTGIWAGDQTKATAGTVAAQTGSAASNTWSAYSLVLAPKTGQTITRGNTTTFTAVAGTTSTATINVPAGVSNGDALVLCEAWYGGTSNVVTFTTPTGWTDITPRLNSGTNPEVLACQIRYASSEPASYTLTWGGSTPGNGQPGPAIFMTDYTNVAAIDNQMTSAMASFAAGDLNKLYCMDGVGGGLTATEQCGKIGTVINSTTVLPTAGDGGDTTVTSKELVYATDDCGGTNAIQSAINGLTTGGTVWMPQALYGCSQTLTFPLALTVNIEGAGSQLNEWSYLGTPTRFGNQAGTAIWFLTKLMTGAGLSFTGTLGHTSQNTTDHAYNLTVRAGAGVANHDGGCTTCNGIDVVNFSHWTGDHLTVQGWGGSGWHEDSFIGGALALDYTVDNRLENSYLLLNGTHGIVLGGNNSNGILETTLIENNEVESNFIDGIHIQTGNASQIIDDVTLIGNLPQWNNTEGALGTGWEINVASDVLGCTMLSNHIEALGNTNEGGVNDGSATANVQGCKIYSNYFNDDGGIATGLKLGVDATHQYRFGVVDGNWFNSVWTTCISRNTALSLGAHNNCNGVDTSWNDGNFPMTGGAIVSSTGGAIPTATCSGGSTGVVIAAGSTNNRGQITTSSSASTNCTITWSAASTWPQAPFCTVTDGAASITPTGVSVGATGTSTMVIDFASASSKVFNWLCM